MIADTERFERAIARFDAIHAADPNMDAAGGERQPKELLYARRMTAMLERFAPEASEAARLAARCQHIRRWEIPRTLYPASPEGYKAWRARLLDHHAAIGAEVLKDCGYDEAMVARVAALIRKERLKRDPDAQLLEDVVGLVFLQHYLADFVAQHRDYDEAKLFDILQKTFRKMSLRGIDAAATPTALPLHLANFVAKAAGAAAFVARSRSG